jgi:alkanesulfonate monooxygenase SsuD/methylene tetrahydromethanopterin reductase-like flavin-dependent oxidoreductase (luciferase family)
MVQCDWATDQPPLIYAGASGPKMLTMSSAVADGVMMGDIAPVMFDWPLPTLNKALAENNKTDGDFRTSNFLAWHIKEDREVAIQEAGVKYSFEVGWNARGWNHF